MKMSTGVAAMKMPDRPPMMNIETNAKANSMAVVKRILAPQTRPSQLNGLMALGRAVIMGETMNVRPRAGFMPDMNMWCPHTMKPSPAMPAMEYTIGL